MNDRRPSLAGCLSGRGRWELDLYLCLGSDNRPALLKDVLFSRRTSTLFFPFPFRGRWVVRDMLRDRTSSHLYADDGARAVGLQVAWRL